MYDDIEFEFRKKCDEYKDEFFDTIFHCNLIAKKVNEYIASTYRREADKLTNERDEKRRKMMGLTGPSNGAHNYQNYYGGPIAGATGTVGPIGPHRFHIGSLNGALYGATGLPLCYHVGSATGAKGITGNPLGNGPRVLDNYNPRKNKKKPRIRTIYLNNNNKALKKKPQKNPVILQQP